MLSSSLILASISSRLSDHFCNESTFDCINSAVRPSCRLSGTFSSLLVVSSLKESILFLISSRSIGSALVVEITMKCMLNCSSLLRMMAGLGVSIVSLGLFLPLVRRNGRA